MKSIGEREELIHLLCESLHPMNQSMIKSSYKQLLRFAKRFDAQPALKVVPVPVILICSLYYRMW